MAINAIKQIASYVCTQFDAVDLVPNMAACFKYILESAVKRTDTLLRHMNMQPMNCAVHKGICAASVGSEKELTASGQLWDCCLAQKMTTTILLTWK